MQSIRILLSKPRANYRDYARRDEMRPRQFFKKGCDEYLVKVIDQTNLISLVDDYTQFTSLNDLLRTVMERVQSIKASLKEKENRTLTD